MYSGDQAAPVGIDCKITCFQNAYVQCKFIYSQLLVTENNDDNSHSQTQDYCPNDIADIMMQPNNQNADQPDYQIFFL